MGLSSEEIYVAEVVAAKISGILSMIGSGLIIRDVILRWRRRKERQFLPIVSRIVLSMSIANLFNSCFVHFAGTWMVPKGNAKVLDETFPIPLATGNDLTCKVQAIFWSLFSLTGGCTNGTLATAYWLLVCKEKKENELNKWKWQILLLWFPWLLGLVDSIVFAVGFGFHVHRDSWFCSSFLSEESPNSKWRNGMLAALAGVINILIIIMMIMLIKFVYTLEKKTDSYRRNGETRQNTIQVTRQGLWFILAYMVAMVPAVLTIVVNDLPGSYLIFVACTRPLQGGFNALVYFRPKYIAERQKMVSTSNARNSRLSSILVTLNMPLPRRSSAFSNNGSGQTMSTPQLLDQHVAENKEQHKSSIDLHNSNGDLLSDNENLA